MEIDNTKKQEAMEKMGIVFKAIEEGLSNATIQKKYGVSRHFCSNVRAALGVSKVRNIGWHSPMISQKKPYLAVNVRSLGYEGRVKWRIMYLKEGKLLIELEKVTT